jgi:type I restriction enzyme S subunit
MSGSSGRQRVSADALNGLEIQLPPIKVQEKIAAILNSIDDRIESNQSIASLLEQEVLAKWDALSDVTDDECSLLELIEVNPRCSLNRGADASYVPMEKLSTTSYRLGGSTGRAASSGSRFQNDDTLVARITPCLENGKLGLVDILKKGEVGWGSTEFIVLRPRPSVNPFIPYVLARSQSFRDFAISHMSGSSGRQRFPAESLVQFRVADLSPAKLTVFSDFASPRQKTMTRLMDEVVHLVELRDFLLPRLLSGELRATSTDEVVEATS